MDEAGVAALDGAGRLVGDLTCVKCEYNLRTLHRDAACPECGTAVGRSIEGNQLRYCDPAWLKQIWEGLNCFGVAVVAGLAFVGFMRWCNGPNDRLLIVGVTFYATALALAIYGFFKATKPDPARIDREHPLSARRLARGAWLGTLVLFVATIVATAATGDDDDLEALAVALMALLFAGPVMLLIHAARLAMRLPNWKLAAAVIGVDAYLVFTGGWVLLTSRYRWWEWLESTFWPGAMDVWWMMARLTPWLTGGLAILLIALLIWYWWALSRAAKFAWETWKKGD